MVQTCPAKQMTQSTFVKKINACCLIKYQCKRICKAQFKCGIYSQKYNKTSQKEEKEENIKQEKRNTPICHPNKNYNGVN